MSTGIRFARQFVNRNPRNMEMLGLQRKPSGSEFEKDNNLRHYIYKVELVQGKTHQEARLTHYRNGVVLTASTREKAISNQLYSNVDTSAAMNLGRVLATRALQSGIHFVMNGVDDEQMERSKHQSAFYQSLSSSGLILSEPSPPSQSYEVDRKMTWERFPVQHTREDKIDDMEQ